MYKDSVIPLYSYDIDTKKYCSVGSAVLIAFRSRLLLITAAHVIDSLKEKKAFIYLERIFYQIGALPIFVSNSSLFQSRDDDPFDIAAILLPEEFAGKCDQKNFITIDQYISGLSVTSSLFQAIGYPHAKNTKAIIKTVRVPGGIRSEAFRYTVSDVSDIAFPHKNFCNEFHIATCMTKTGRLQGSDNYLNIPDLHGISGGLLQKVTEYNSSTDGFDIAYPAAIILEKHQDNTRFFSLKLGAVFDWLHFQWEYLTAQNT